jgi:hemolysin D
MKLFSGAVAYLHKKMRWEDDDRAFLPAALEIVETPASPIGRIIAYTIMALFSLAVLWACIGKVDIVASAQGKIIPDGRTKVIQPFETGVVRSIDVQDGQAVKAGQTLIQLDQTLNDADQRRAQGDLIAAELDVARLQAELEPGDPFENFKPSLDAPADLVAMQRKFLIDQVGEQRAKLLVLERQRAEKQAEFDTASATVAKLEAVLPVLKQRLDIVETLYNHSTGSKANYLELLQTYVEQQHELEVQKSKSREAQETLAAITESRAQTEAEFRRTRYSELDDAQRKAHDAREDLVKARHRAALQKLTAPVDGTVQQLAVHTIGGVVTPAQTLLAIVPAGSKLMIDASVQNRDIGFVEVGQDAQIKIDTFNFSRYGLLHGKVLSVSQDSMERQKPGDKTNGDPQKKIDEDSSEPPGGELVYDAHVALDSTQMQIGDKLVNLEPGMAVTVEIKTGERRIISYLLSPLMRYKEDALRER